MVTRLIVASFVGGIVMFFLGFLIYGLALETFMKENTVQYVGLIREPPNMVMIGVANLVYGLLLAFVADYWARVRTFAGGAKVGAIVSFLIALWINSMFEAFWVLYIGFLPVLVDIVATTVMGAIAGGAIGVVLGKMDNKTETA